MKLILFALAILVAVTLATLMAIEDPGYVLLARGAWSAEMPFTVFIPLMLLAALALFIALYIVVRLIRIPRDVTRWRLRRQARRSRMALLTGLTQLIEGNWAEAEVALLAARRHGDSPLLAYLGAACAAQGQAQIEKRDDYLAQAHHQAPHAELAIGMVQAYLQHLSHQQEQTLATLTELHRELPRHKQVLKLLARTYTGLHDWTALIELLPELRRQQALAPGEADDLELRAHRELLTQALPTGSLDVLNRAWNAVPKMLKRHPGMIASYARQLIAQGDMRSAEQLLRTTLDKVWDDDLADLYGQLNLDDAGETLETAEGWLAGHPDNPRLLLALGRLALRAGDLARARGYFERSVVRRPVAETFHEFGLLLEQLGDTAGALSAYRRGMESSLEEESRGTVPRLYRYSPTRSQAAR